MNYEKIYNDIITRAQNRDSNELEYYEIHHIKPKSLGGDNNPCNLVKLQYREHFICHLLLIKMTTGMDRIKMAYAVHMMISSGKRDRNKNRTYDMYRSYLAKYKVPKECSAKIAYDNMQPKMLQLLRSGKSAVVCEYCGLTNYTTIGDNFNCSFCRNGKRDTDKIKQYPICLCGCGNHTASVSCLWITNHETICGCGCGQVKPITQNKSSPVVYLPGHFRNPNTQKTSETLKKTLAEMPADEMEVRLQNSLRNCDHEQRIRNMKVGKSSLIEVTKPDGSVLHVLTCDMEETIGVTWHSARYILKYCNGFQRTTGNTYRYLERYIPNYLKKMIHERI